MDKKSPFTKLPPLLACLRYIVQKIRIWKILFKNYNRIDIGAKFVVGPAARVYIPDAGKIASRVAIGGNFICQTNISIGNDCLLSSNVSFIGNDHYLEDSESAYYSGRSPPSNIVLEGNNFIGFNSTLLGNITVGEGAIVGACALVLEDVPPYSIVAGVPAKVIRKRELK